MSDYLTAVSLFVTHSAEVHGPSTVRGGGHDVGAAALEVEVLSVEGAVVRPAPGQAGGRTLGVPQRPQNPPTARGGGRGVCRDTEFWVAVRGKAPNISVAIPTLRQAETEVSTFSSASWKTILI